MNQRPSSLPIWFDEVSDQQHYPSLSGDTTTDVVIIGGGIVGLLAAWNLGQQGTRVILLEKNHLATGDSGSTTAFLSRVPDVNISSLQERQGKSLLQQVFDASANAQQELFALIQNHHIACDFQSLPSYYGSYGLNDPTLTSEWKTIHDLANVNAERMSSPPSPFKDAVTFAHEGTFHIRKFLQSLANAMPDHVTIHEQTEVTAVRDGTSITVQTSSGRIQAKRVIVAVGDPAGLFPETQSFIHRFVTFVIAIRSSQLSCPMGLYWDTEDPYFYFRPLDPQSMIIGGADIAFEKANAATGFKILQTFVRDHLTSSFDVTHQWSGSIFHTDDGLPYVFRHPAFQQPCLIATGFAGNGMIFGALSAKIAAEMAMEQERKDHALLALSRTGVQAPTQHQAAREKQQSTGGFISLGSLNDYPDGKPQCKNVNGTTIFVLRRGNTVLAMDNACSHAGGSLCDGTLEGDTIECPLHASQFNIKTGAVLRPPAVRPQQTYEVRIHEDTVQVRLDQRLPPSSASASIPRKHWKSVFQFLPLPLILWLLEFFAQYWWLTKGEIGGSLVRSFALTGATLIAAALFTSAVFRGYPTLAKHWRLRRYLGVSGFIFITLHVLSVEHFLFQYNIAATYYSLNPIVNPIIFGTGAYVILFLMASTSTDWAVQKLSPKRWKILHRFVYLAEIGAIFHFLFINPDLLKNPPGYFLLTLMGFAVLGQCYWWIRISAKRKFKTPGALVGFLLLLLVGMLGVLEYQHLRPLTTAVKEKTLEDAVEEMKASMEAGGIDEEISTEPIAEDQDFSASMTQKGTFQNLNYMSSGDVQIEQEDETFYVVFQDSFETPNGPDLQVYLTKNTDPTTREDIAEGINLGKLKSVKGKQVYEIPSSVDLRDVHAVTIHCKAFNVPWSFAPLNP
jgi:glycine/D-amino acid oxidase-like deaminating enzyme/nitrite reductase/ring-hydroxylating ferredoxin subunit/DMSO/TMAO reductase YedYZ heme-binding membrane subunit